MTILRFFAIESCTDTYDLKHATLKYEGEGVTNNQFLYDPITQNSGSLNWAIRFSRIGIKIEKDDVKTECRHKLERIYPVDREKFSWLSNWINTY